MNKEMRFYLCFAKKNNGLTLIETLVAVFILSLITIALFTLISWLYQTNTLVWQQAEAIEEARRGVKVMIREIRGADSGQDGSFAIEKAADSEFIFYSDIDKDGKTERVRYFLGGTFTLEQTKECVSYVKGGACSVTFSGFYQGQLEKARVQISIEGDFGMASEKAEVFADGLKLGELCAVSGECNDCAGFWQGTKIFDVINQAQDNYLQLTADSSSNVDPSCNWEQPSHSMKAQFKLIWTDTLSGWEREFRKGVIEPVGSPPTYPKAQESIIILSRFVQNKLEDPQKYLFKYFNKDGQEITEYPARPEETQLMQVSLIINADPNRSLEDYNLTSRVQLRNLRKINE